MAITTYTELQAAAANWLSRADLTSRIPEAIALCESKFQRQLNTTDMETRNESFSITGEYVAVPTDFIEARHFMLNAEPRMTIKYLPPETQSDNFGGPGGFGANPSYFSVVGGYFRFAPVPTTTYASTLIYYAKVAALSGSVATNWLLTKHPDAYLYGTLLELVAGPLQDDSRVSIWKQGYDEAIAYIKAQSARSRYGANAIASRPERAA